MDDGGRAVDSGKIFIRPRASPLSSPPFRSKSGGVVDGRKSEENEKSRRKRTQRGREAAPDDTDDRARNPRALASTFNEAVRG